MIYILRVVHILSGIFWVGAVLFATLVLMPALRAAGPAGGAVMGQLAQRRMPVVMMVSAFLSIGSGIWLMMIVSAGNMGLWMQSGTGRTLGWGGALAILAVILGMAINAPAASRMAAITRAAAQRGGAPTADETAEIARLQRRLGLASQLVTVLLSLAAVAMAVARYVP